MDKYHNKRKMGSLRFNLLLFILFALLQQSFAQKMKFTSDTAYINELRVFMGLVDQKEPDPVFTQFTSYWNDGQINTAQKQTILLISNNLLNKRARPNPHFRNFIKYILSVLNAKSISQEFGRWLNVIEVYSVSSDFNVIRLDKLMDDLILLNDSSTLYISRAVEWRHNADQYKLIFDGNATLQVYFEKTDLICLAKRDSSIISNTSGYFYPLSNNWVGKSGSLSWERAELSKDSVNAQLNNYRIDLKFSEFSADTVEFINKKYLNSSLTGHLEEKLLANARGEKASYPKFISYDKTVDIKQVVPNIDFSGGFSMEGNKFIGLGDTAKKAELFIYKDKELFARAYSDVFSFDIHNIIGNNTHVNLFIDQDTIWHPGLSFNYLINNQRIALNRSGGGHFRSKFYDSYHKLEIDVNEITFDLKDSLILFKSPPASTYRKAIFESSNFFSVAVYKDVALTDRVHPLEAIREIAPNVGQQFEAIELAYYLNKAEPFCINMLSRLSDMGFVNYNAETKIAYPEKKLFDYIKNNYGKQDYDAIRIISEPLKGQNAELNLKDKVLTVHGVQSFVLSNNRRVGAIPDNETIRIKKDLEIDFDGKLEAGLARLYGKGMTFNYDSFLVNLQQIDSLNLTYRSDTKNQDSTFEYTPLVSTIDSISGLLRIDNPENKSGLSTFPNYPILESHEKSYVFYDQKSEKDTVYGKNEFYVENYPFELDSLNTIQAKNISIKGNLKSGGVFPEFDEYLLVQPDNSLGFVHKLDSAGMPLYQGLAKYDNTVKLDNSGLKGDGKVKYLNTVIYAEMFNFFPDSMNTYASRIEMDKQKADSLELNYPEVNADSIYVFWEPKKDQMFLTTLDKPFSVFEEKASLNGSLELKSTKLAGKGQLTISDAELDSESYTFYDESFKADNADFRLNPIKGEKSPFLTYNVAADVDFNKKLGLFNSNGKNSYIDLPVNQYKCYMNFFSWHMGINQIDIGTTQKLRSDSIPDIALADSLYNSLDTDSASYLVSFADTVLSPNELASSSRFVSTHYDQDSLSFYASSSTYDIKYHIIKAKGVKFIPVADAFIFPSGILTILSDAKIKTLVNARILVDRKTSFHKFYDASVDIVGAKKYIASADYEYYDRQDSLQMIHFSEIGVNAEMQTIASGEIEENGRFNLSPEFSYFGKVLLKAPVKNLEFDGYTKINHLCEKRLPDFWLQFKSIIDPDSIVIPIEDQPIDNEFRKLQTALFLTNDSVGIYPGFLTTKRRFSDVPVLQTNGLLYYNTKTGYFEITDSAKLANPEKEGNYLSFHKKLCLVHGEGKMDLAANLGQVKANPVGFVRHNLDSYKTELIIMLGVDFFFNDAALNLMSANLNEAYSLPPVDPTSKEYQRSFKELCGVKQRDYLMKDFALLGGFSNVPPEMNSTLFFSDVKLKWNILQTAWQSEGKIGLGNLKNNQVNKMFDGYIESKKVKSGDILNIYLEIDPKNWYFFTYTRGTLKTISSNNDYNNAVTNLKDKYRKAPDSQDDTPYMFFPATERAKDNFIEEMKKQKLAALEMKDINLDFSYENQDNKDENKDKTETEMEEEEIEDGENVMENPIIEMEELETDDIQNLEQIKADNNTQEEINDSGNIDLENLEPIKTDDSEMETETNYDTIPQKGNSEEIKLDETNSKQENKTNVKKEELKIKDPKKMGENKSGIKKDDPAKKDLKKNDKKLKEETEEEEMEEIEYEEEEEEGEG